MTEKRKKVTKFILDHIGMLEKNMWNNKNIETNKERMDRFLNSLSDKDFDTYMKALRDGTTELFIFAPNIKSILKMEDILATADKLGLELFEPLRMTDASTGQEYITPEKYLIAQLPVRRTIQTILHKRSIAQSDENIDSLTGQVVREDKAASLSKIEVQVLLSKDLNYTTRELMKYRGGDLYAYLDMKRSLEESGHASITLDNTGTIARSAGMYQVFLKGMHVNINMIG